MGAADFCHSLRLLRAHPEHGHAIRYGRLSCVCRGLPLRGNGARDAVRSRAPSVAASAQIAIAGAAALYIGEWRGWARHLSQPIDRQTLDMQLAEIDSRAWDMPEIPASFKCDEPRGRPPVHTHLEDWRFDCTFRSGMVFAMPHSPCVSFTFGPSGSTWSFADEESLAHFRANGDFDRLVKCGATQIEGNTRQVTMCDPHTPAFLLDGLRLYTIGSLDDNLSPIDRLKLLQIDAALRAVEHSSVIRLDSICKQHGQQLLFLDASMSVFRARRWGSSVQRPPASQRCFE